MLRNNQTEPRGNNSPTKGLCVEQTSPLQPPVLSLISRVHLKGNEGLEKRARARVSPQEILADLRAKMPHQFLIQKYRLPPEGVRFVLSSRNNSQPTKNQELLKKAVQNSTDATEIADLITIDEESASSSYLRSHPSHLSLMLTREERKYLLHDFRDDAVRSLCADACLEHRTMEPSHVMREHAVEGI